MVTSVYKKSKKMLTPTRAKMIKNRGRKSAADEYLEMYGNVSKKKGRKGK